MGFRNGKPSKQFTAIPNSLIRDYNLTDSTFRLICWVASHDENFDISFSVIEKYLGKFVVLSKMLNKTTT